MTPCPLRLQHLRLRRELAVYHPLFLSIHPCHHRRKAVLPLHRLRISFVADLPLIVASVRYPLLDRLEKKRKERLLNMMEITTLISHRE
jgi:hypothetical protein